MTRYNQSLHEKVEEFQTFHGIKPPNCISDRILLYIKYIVDQVRKRPIKSVYSWKTGKANEYSYPAFRTQEEFDAAHNVYEEQVLRIYFDIIRSNMKYTNRNPVTVAAACCWLGNKLLSKEDKIYITQNDIMTFIQNPDYRSNQTGVRIMSHIIEEDIKNLAHSIRF